MVGELAAVVEGDGLAPLGREAQQETYHGISNRASRFLEQWVSQDEAGVAFLEDQEGLTAVAEEYQIGLPVAWKGAVVRLWGTLGEGLAQVDIANGVTPATTAIPFGLASCQQTESGGVLGAIALGMDEAVDGLVGYEGAASFQCQATGDLLGRPASTQSGEDGFSQSRVPVQPGAPPTTGPSLLVGIAWIISFGIGSVALQLSRNRRWRAIQTCRDLAERKSLSS